MIIKPILNHNQTIDFIVVCPIQQNSERASYKQAKKHWQINQKHKAIGLKLDMAD